MQKDLEENKRLKKALTSQILSLLVKLIGESISNKVARAAIVGMIGMAGYYFDLPDIDTSSAPPVQVESVQ